MMKKFLLSILLLATAIAAATAQADSTVARQKKERRVELYGSVYDSFTKARLKAHVTLMRTDSTVVDTTTCWTWGTQSYYEFKVPARQADYIVKAEHEGYDDTYMNYALRHMARNNRFELPRLLMKKRQQQDDDLWREGTLDGVVVTGTKVKIAYRGDTIVYNASAFNMPEGSMLDGLIRQMPGAELRDNGDIYINGKKVDYLTLNGKDFFKGQNKVMLENLPYFTVKDIKVFHKSTRQSEMLGRDVEQRDYVMDVSLKREYNRGYMANAEGGAGTGHRYMGRFFGLYYDDHSRLSLFGNANNVNENRRPGGDGEWRPSNMPVGLRSTKQTGLSFTTEDQDKTWEESLDATLDWSDNEEQSITSSETFATDGSIYAGRTSMSRQKDFRFSMSNRFQVEKPVMLFTDLRASYINGRRNTGSQDSTYREHVINSMQNAGLGKYRTLSLAGNVSLYKKFDWGDYVTLAVNADYTRQKPSEGFSRSDTRYAETGTAECREYYQDTRQDGYNYRIDLGYVLQMLNNWYINTAARYTQSQRSLRGSNYRLDWMGNLTPHDLGWLPSTAGALDSVIDPANSNTHHNLTRTYQGQLSVTRGMDDSYLSVDLSVSRSQERMHFMQSALDTVATRGYTTIAPSLFYGRWRGNGLRQVYYSMQTDQPDFASLMPTGNDTNPLARRLNNPGLKARLTHQLSLYFQFSNDSLKRDLSLWTNARLVQRAWGTRTVYNTETGAYTYQNDNVRGANWYWGAGGSYTCPLDRQKRLTLTQRNDIEYTHSVDFAIQYTTAAMPAAITSAPTSTVHNLTLAETLKLEYQRDALTVSLSGHVDWRRATSQRENFQDISAFDYDYGMALRYTVPWLKVDIATDLRMYSRRGYYSSMMNDDHLICNAELSRSLVKGKLTAKLQAFDLFRQLSNTQYSVNAQGRTETWQNAIPRYVMLTLAYKFTRKPEE